MKIKEYIEDMGQTHKQGEIEAKQFRPIKRDRTFVSQSFIIAYFTEDKEFIIPSRHMIQRKIQVCEFKIHLN